MVIRRTIKNAVSTPSLVTVKIQKENRGSPGVYSRFSTAVKQMMNYLENGNILNSVNYPKCDMGICTQAGRIAIFHRNKANMITKFTACFGDEGVNITDMMNKSKGEVAYTMMDLESPATDEMIGRLQSIAGVFRVRVVK